MNASLPQDRRQDCLVDVAELVGGVAGVGTDGVLVHRRYAQCRLAVEVGEGLAVVGPGDRGRGDPGGLARQLGVRVVGSELRGRLRVKLGPVGKDDVMKT